MTDTTQPAVPLSDEQLATIRHRNAAATPGPWHVEDADQDLTRWVTDEIGTLDISFGYVGNRTKPDAEFVAHARTDVPALLAELDRLRAERDQYADRVDTLTAVAKGNKRHVQEMYLDLQKAQAEVERLRGYISTAAVITRDRETPPAKLLAELDELFNG